ncbi:MAG: hypothetical protein E4H00_09805 [Myxococcales bacterium]|nr:MAG: hypothetical protein E4H00_09805 [Myxococcales bacterium]
MPVWHKASRRWVEEGKLALVEITQEQHPDRCRLFAQWQRFDWPILHDPIDVTGAVAVPIVMAIDEHGIVRSVRPNVETFEKDFLNKTFPAPGDSLPSPPSIPAKPDLSALHRGAEMLNTAQAWQQYGDALVLWAGIDENEAAIEAYRRSLQMSARDGGLHFRLGVCYRRRYESQHREDGDFQRAVDAWNRALDIDPNHYIWRRRIQQYGPRLIKPYPFYDWVDQAAREIRARGETPVELAVRPSGAEIEQPQRHFSEIGQHETAPDPDGRIHRDKARLIETEVVVVPPRIKPGESVRVHVTMRPSKTADAHWNNENEPVKLWVNALGGWKTDRQLLIAPLGERPETNESRSFEFELKSPDDAKGSVRLSTYTLYYACEGIDGTCLYLRQDIPVDVRFER